MDKEQLWHETRQQTTELIARCKDLYVDLTLIVKWFWKLLKEPL